MLSDSDLWVFVQYVLISLPRRPVPRHNLSPLKSLIYEMGLDKEHGGTRVPVVLDKFLAKKER